MDRYLQVKFKLFNFAVQRYIHLLNFQRSQFIICYDSSHPTTGKKIPKCQTVDYFTNERDTSDIFLLLLAMPCSMQDLSSPARDPTQALLQWEH